jgi:hypothetical protein
VLVYFRLDATPLPPESLYRLAINAWGMSFEDACIELWRNLVEKPAEPLRIDLSRYRRHAPWRQEDGGEEAG